MAGNTEQRAFHRTLISRLHLDDNAWEFTVDNLPSASTLRKAGLIKAISIHTDASKHSMALKLERSNSNRAIELDQLDRFILLSLERFRPLVRAALAKEEAPALNLQPRTGRDVSDYCIKVLRAGIVINGVRYNFYGHSNSQLKSRSCFLMAATKEEISRRVEALGDFSKMKTVGKKAKRIGLLFSSAEVAMVIAPDRVEDIGDVETADYVFTDGCGLIAPNLAQELARRTRILFRNNRYTPSVFQIRYRGYKGVVTVDPRMRKQKTLLKFRKSMKKFSGGDNHSFAVVDYSKPFSYGFLNDETIILLNALGITQETLLRKQREHFHLLRNAKVDFRDAFRFLSYINRPDLAERVLLEGIEMVQPQIRRLINTELGKMLNKRDEQRCRIFVQKSRLLFGVCDAWDVLKEGECAVKVTMEENGQPYALKGTEIAVIRNPCLHPGDWQKFKVVERPELSHLVDCIVFSTKGSRPAADLMSGGDLDGDQFFVLWDPDLIPSTIAFPALYPGGRDPMLFRPITDDDRLVYFAKYTNASLGQVKNLYLDWARATSPMSAQCQELNRLFSECVDGNRIKVPEKLRAPPKAPQDAPPFILDVLHDDSKKKVNHMMLSEEADVTGYDMSAMHLLLGREDIAMSEFEFVKLAYTWCWKNATSFENFLPLFDFNVLTSEQKAWVLAQLPMSVSAPALVMNALCSSNILHQDELQHFHLDYPGIKWKRTYDSSIERLATFHDALLTNLEVFQRTLIVFQPDERLSLAIYIPKKVERGSDCLVDNTGRLFAFPHSQGPQHQSRLALPTKMGYQLYCDHNVFQLFENQRSNSWVFLTRPGNNDEEYRNIQNQGERRRKRQDVIDRGKQAEVCASVALNKFSRHLQTHLGRVNRSPVTAAEIYVISNRDVASMNSLDLWLEYVETEEKLPLFSQEAKPYSIPNRREVVSSSSPPWLFEIIAQNDLRKLNHLESVAQYRLVFTSIRRTGDIGSLLQCYEHILENLADTAIEPKLILQEMIEFLATEPTLVVAFAPTFASLHEGQGQNLAAVLEASLLSFLRAFVLSANTMGQLILEPFKTMLSNFPPGALSVNDVADYIELASLTIRSTELALDLLLSCFQPKSDRLTTADPRVTHHLLRNLIAIAIDHIEEAKTVVKRQPGLLDLKLYPKSKESGIIEVDFRIDAMGTPRNSSHIRLTTATIPSNVLVGTNYSMDAMVIFSESGRARFKCLHPLPPYFADCQWILEDCGPFVTTKSMMDAVRNLNTSLDECCGVASTIIGIPPSPSLPAAGRNWQDVSRLNPSQNHAISLALNNPLLCLWGPPGTGKTETIVEMICALQTVDEGAHVLVTAPTHNAVDNLMRRYMQRIQGGNLARATQPVVLRVSTEVRKVADDLRKYTCDAMAGQEIHANYQAMEKATQMIKRSNTIFTTCIGAGIGLLRSECFDIVVVDEASQQTEPSSLVPLVKGCSKAILVGDHVQLRPTVNPTALALDFDVSLFERLYAASRSPTTGGGLQTLMLDTQYRMHPRLCEFSSKEFYEGNLISGVDRTARPLHTSSFPFPEVTVADDRGVSVLSDYERAIFIDCDSKEEPGGKSKENRGQAELCVNVCKLLTRQPHVQTGKYQTPTSLAGPHTIVVLTPYTRQAELLKRMLANVAQSIEVSSIDGFQGREADIIVFVTVRCNEHRDIGFLKDTRRMNVAVTRARTALIVVGNRATLTQGTADKETSAVWKRLLSGLKEVKLDRA